MMTTRALAAALLALSLAACARGDAPAHMDDDTTGVAGPDTGQFPVQAPGDPFPGPPIDDPVTGTPAAPPAGTPPVQTPGRPAQPAPAPPPTPTPSEPVVDSVRGQVAVVGAAPMTQVVLRRTGTPDAQLTGGAAMMRSLRSVQGLEVMASGHRVDDRTMHVTAFAVRAANGVAAVDGTLRREDNRYMLVAANGERHAVQHLPAALAERVGQRVWIAGPLDREAESFGVID